MSNNPFKQCFFSVLFLTVVVAFQVKADVKFSGIFGDNMVLQQQSQAAVWGWAKANTNVSIVTSWDKKSYSVRSDGNGYWKVKIQTPKASFMPHTLTASDGKSVTLSNILIGEVWVCSGQSNMEMPMKGWNTRIDGGPNDINHSTNPGIRCFTMVKASKAQAQDDCKGKWEEANPQTVPFFTATGYYFGRLINEALNVPVGLIHTSWSASRIEAWMTPASLKDIPEKIIPATDADIKIPNQEGTLLYNGMVNPIVGYGIRGVIWYQGESNKVEPDLYVKMFDRMVREWRNIWGIGEFPFYYCQIAPYNYTGWPPPSSCYIREAQSKGM
ncbi:MAG: sialate O-acetylesterase, partial [Tannerella sp.]|nr:sialate O-acetylesterase [Tannerella sp.]